jgi:intein/homing endonuclease
MANFKNSEKYLRFIEDNFLIVSKDGRIQKFNENETHWNLQSKFLLEDATGRDVILKARQMGFSSIILAIFTVDFIAKPNSYSMVISDKSDNSEDLLQRVKFYLKSFEELNKIQIKLKYNSKYELFNEEINSIYKIGTAENKEVGRSKSLSGLHLSEAAYFPDFEAILRSALQAVVPDGKIFIESCVSGDTLVFSNKGIKKIKDFFPNTIEKKGFLSVENKILLYGRKEINEVSALFFNGFSKTKKIITRKGYFLEGTFNHPILIMKDGFLKWKKINEIREGDEVVIQYNQNLFGKNEIDNDLAYLLGLYISEGYIRDKGRTWYMVITSEDEEIHQFLKEKFNAYKDKGDIFHSRIVNKTLIKKIKDLGFDFSKKSFQKEIPDFILGLKKENLKNFISGIFDGDGSARRDRGSINYVSTSLNLIRTIQIILLNFGIVSVVRKNTPPKKKSFINGRYFIGKRNCYTLEISGYFSKIFFEKIGFRLKRKQEVYNILKNKKFKRVILLPLYRRLKEDLEKIKIDIKGLYRNYKISSEWYLNKSKIEKKTLEKIIKTFNIKGYEEILNSFYFIDTVKKIEFSENYTYDVTVPNTHSFFSNGFISHNTANGFNFFKTFWDECTLGKRNFHPIFYPASFFYDHEFLESKRGELGEAFTQEYPNEAAEAFLTTGETYFEKEALAWYLENYKAPLRISERYV